jgi:hypothetical protein
MEFTGKKEWPETYKNILPLFHLNKRGNAKKLLEIPLLTN